MQRDLSVYTTKQNKNSHISKLLKNDFFFFLQVRISPNSSKSSSNHAIEQVCVAYSTSLLNFLFKFCDFLKKLDIYRFLEICLHVSFDDC